jgi:hypothetical protein
MVANNWFLIQVVLTLTATGTLMWFVQRRRELGQYGSLIASLAGIAFLCGLYALGVPSAGYVLMGLVVIVALAFFLGMLSGIDL